MGLPEAEDRLEREVALKRLHALVGHDIRPLADDYGVTVVRNGRLNKGWAGQVIERYLGLSANASPRPDFGSWELKVVPLRFNRHGDLWPKETMAIAMVNEAELETCEFDESHLLEKLARIVIAARIHEPNDDERSIFFTATEYDLDEPRIYEQVREDYEEARWVVQQSGLYGLNGLMGRLVQPRPKGPGRGSSTMGFYARKEFVAHMLGLRPLPTG